MSIGMIILIVYGVGIVVTFIPFSKFFAYFLQNDSANKDDWVDFPDKETLMMGILIGGICCSWMWPLLIPAYWAYKVITMDTKPIKWYSDE